MKPQDVPDRWRFSGSGTDDSQARELTIEVGVTLPDESIVWKPIETFLFNLLVDALAQEQSQG